MLKDRQYLVAESELQISLEKFRERFHDRPTKDELTILTSRSENIEDQIFVFFEESEPGKRKISNKSILAYYQRMKSEGVLHSILILPTKLGQTAENLLKQILHGSENTITIETFQEIELTVNTTNHVLVPIHQLLSDGEKKKLLDRYKLKISQL